MVFLRKMHGQMEIRRKCNNFLWKIGNLGGIGSKRLHDDVLRRPN